MTDEIHVLGLNGGGSHTQAVILNQKGETLGQGEGGPANIRAVDLETAKKSLTDAIQQALKSADILADKLAGAALGLAGDPWTGAEEAVSERPLLHGRVLDVATERIHRATPPRLGNRPAQQAGRGWKGFVVKISQGPDHVNFI